MYSLLSVHLYLLIFLAQVTTTVFLKYLINYSRYSIKHESNFFVTISITRDTIIVHQNSCIISISLILTSFIPVLEILRSVHKIEPDIPPIISVRYSVHLLG